MTRYQASCQALLIHPILTDMILGRQNYSSFLTIQLSLVEQKGFPSVAKPIWYFAQYSVANVISITLGSHSKGATNGLNAQGVADILEQRSQVRCCFVKTLKETCPMHCLAACFQWPVLPHFLVFVKVSSFGVSMPSVNKGAPQSQVIISGILASSSKRCKDILHYSFYKNVASWSYSILYPSAEP